VNGRNLDRGKRAEISSSTWLSRGYISINGEILQKGKKIDSEPGGIKENAL